MRMYVLKGSDHADNSALFDQLYRLRHDTFIKHRGWSLPAKGEWEIDEYDTASAIYFIDLDDKGNIQSTVRITPTITSSLTADYFPHLIENGSSGRSEKIYEATRYIVRPIDRSRESNRAAKVRLLIRLTAWCVAHQVTHLQTIIDAGTLNSYLELNPWIKVLGLSHPFGGGKKVKGGGECIAIHWPNTPEVIEHLNDYARDYQPKDIMTYEKANGFVSQHVH